MIASVDAERLGRVLRNLLGNAQKYGREHGTIRVAVERSGAEVCISVADDGPGVSGDAASVFSTNGQGGHGFGLPLAAALADAEGARLRLAHGGPGPVFELAVR